jgi:hypothetical protein
MVLADLPVEDSLQLAFLFNRFERREALVERDHEFTVQLAGEDTYVVKLLEGVQIERRDDAVVGRWPDLDLDAKGDSEAEVYQEPLGGLRQKIRTGPGSSEFEPFAAYVREHGTRLSDEEAAARELAKLREITVRWHVTDDEQYMVRLFADVDVQRDGDTVTVHAFGLDGSGQQTGEALRARSSTPSVRPAANTMHLVRASTSSRPGCGPTASRYRPKSWHRRRRTNMPTGGAREAGRDRAGGHRRRELDRRPIAGRLLGRVVRAVPHGDAGAGRTG